MVCVAPKLPQRGTGRRARSFACSSLSGDGGPRRDVRAISVIWATKCASRVCVYLVGISRGAFATLSGGTMRMRVLPGRESS